MALGISHCYMDLDVAFPFLDLAHPCSFSNQLRALHRVGIREHWWS